MHPATASMRLAFEKVARIKMAVYEVSVSAACSSYVTVTYRNKSVWKDGGVP
jgi:hypothetical protein